MAALHTVRLDLRAPSAADIDLVATLGDDPRVMAPLGGQRSRAQCQAWLERELEHHREHGYGRYVVMRQDRFIGLVGLTRGDFERGIVPGVEVAWQLAFDHWRQGYATEAARAVIEQGFSHFDLPEVIAVTSADNIRSRRVMERLGMVHSPSETFDHALLPERHPLQSHVVYRLLRRPSCATAVPGPPQK